MVNDARWDETKEQERRLLKNIGADSANRTWCLAQISQDAQSLTKLERYTDSSLGTFAPSPQKKKRKKNRREEFILRGGGGCTQPTQKVKSIFPYFIVRICPLDPVNDCSYFLLFMTREGKSMNEERALAYANKVYRTMKIEPLAKSSVETRRIRDVFFEKR